MASLKKIGELTILALSSLSKIDSFLTGVKLSAVEVEGAGLDGAADVVGVEDGSIAFTVQSIAFVRNSSDAKRSDLKRGSTRVATASSSSCKKPPNLVSMSSTKIRHRPSSQISG